MTPAQKGNEESGDVSKASSIGAATKRIIPLVNIGIDKNDPRWPRNNMIILHAYDHPKYNETKNTEVPIALANEFLEKGEAVDNQDDLEEYNHDPKKFRVEMRRRQAKAAKKKV